MILTKDFHKLQAKRQSVNRMFADIERDVKHGLLLPSTKWCDFLELYKRGHINGRSRIHCYEKSDIIFSKMNLMRELKFSIAQTSASIPVNDRIENFKSDGTPMQLVFLDFCVHPSKPMLPFIRNEIVPNLDNDGLFGATFCLGQIKPYSYAAQMVDAVVQRIEIDSKRDDIMLQAFDDYKGKENWAKNDESFNTMTYAYGFWILFHALVSERWEANLNCRIYMNWNPSGYHGMPMILLWANKLKRRKFASRTASKILTLAESVDN